MAEAEPQVPGVTAVDLEHLALRRTPQPKRNRLVSWISGIDDTLDEPVATAPPGSLTLPPPEVKREIFRLELQAKLAELTAEADAIKADEAIESGSSARATGGTTPGPTGETPSTPATPSASAEPAGSTEQVDPAPAVERSEPGPSSDPGATIEPGASIDPGTGGPSPA